LNCQGAVISSLLRSLSYKLNHFVDVNEMVWLVSLGGCRGRFIEVSMLGAME